MGTTPAQVIVLDAGALIAFERADERMRALCRRSLKTGAILMIPAGVVAQVFRDRRRQVALRALLNGPTTRIAPLDRGMAEAAGELCGRTSTSDVIDASVVLTARREHATIVTSDEGDLRRLDAKARLERV